MWYRTHKALPARLTKVHSASFANIWSCARAFAADVHEPVSALDATSPRQELREQSAPAYPPEHAQSPSVPHGNPLQSILDTQGSAAVS
eukprot:3665197-Prymnesium_polylepis.1